MGTKRRKDPESVPPKMFQHNIKPSKVLLVLKTTNWVITPNCVTTTQAHKYSPHRNTSMCQCRSATTLRPHRIPVIRDLPSKKQRPSWSIIHTKLRKSSGNEVRHQSVGAGAKRRSTLHIRVRGSSKLRRETTPTRVTL